MKYRADIDGLRALAVLPVVFFHANSSLFSGGFVGVDVFFVISGFLITKIILGEIEQDKFSITNFYERRIRRIFPALMSVLVVTTLLATFILIPSDLELYGKSLLATVFFASNILFWRETGYFAGPSEDILLLHTWSLAVEEQFYIFFPIYMILVCRFMKRGLLPLTILFFCISFGISVWGVYYEPTATFYLLPTRAWELLIGSLLAFSFLPKPKGQLFKEVAAATGMIMILIAVFMYDRETLFPGHGALLPCIGAALIIYAGRANDEHPSLVAKLLSLKPVVLIGLISYSLYLWHWPLLVFAKYVSVGEENLLYIYVAIALSFVLSYLSWKYIEAPFRGKNALFNRAQIFKISGVLIVLLGGMGGAMYVTKGAPERVSTDVITMEQVAQERDALELCPLPLMPSENGIRKGAICRIGSQDAPIDYALIGDSHAMAVHRSVSSVLEDAKRGGVFISSKGCAFIPNMRYQNQKKSLDGCDIFTKDTIKYLEQNSDIKTVFIVSRWSRPIIGAVEFYGAVERGMANFMYTDTKFVVNTQIERIHMAKRELSTLTQRLNEMGKQVHILTPTPEIGFDVAKLHARAYHLGKDIALNLDVEDYMARHAWFLDLSQKLENVNILDAKNVLCNKSTCASMQNQKLLYLDDDHLSNEGARLLKPLFRQTMH